MEISDQLRCLFSGRVDEADGSYVIEIPKQELELGTIEADQTYRVALVPAPEAGDSSGGERSTNGERRSSDANRSHNGHERTDASSTDSAESDTGADDESDGGSSDEASTDESATADASESDRRHDGNRGRQRPPVEEGETRRVEIQDLGDQGDGITRVERGFVVIVPDTDQGERVEIEITDVRENVAFGEVVERLSYYG